MKSIDKNCKYCDILFQASLKEHKRGNAIYCCRICANAGTAKSKAAAYENREHNVCCAVCKISFYRVASKIKIAKHGFQFCSRRCKEAAQKINSSHSIKEIMPPHYGDGSTSYTPSYKAAALRAHGACCQTCTYDDVPEVLQVHHIDHNRQNNDLDNLRVLCPTCHMVEHFRLRTGWYAFSKRKASMIKEDAA